MNLGIIGVGVSVPKEYHTHINRVIEAINEIETKINIKLQKNINGLVNINLNPFIKEPLFKISITSSMHIGSNIKIRILFLYILFLKKSFILFISIAFPSTYIFDKLVIV